MNWILEDLLIMEAIEPGMVFGQMDIVCRVCNCRYEAVYEYQHESGCGCPNCGELNKL